MYRGDAIVYQAEKGGRKLAQSYQRKSGEPVRGTPFLHITAVLIFQSATQNVSSDLRGVDDLSKNCNQEFEIPSMIRGDKPYKWTYWVLVGRRFSMHVP